MQYELVMSGHRTHLTQTFELRITVAFFFIIKVKFKKHLTKNIQKEYVQMIFTLVKCKSKCSNIFFFFL